MGRFVFHHPSGLPGVIPGSPISIQKRNLDTVERYLDSAERWKDRYFESLAKVNAEAGRTEALALKRSNFPPALYRYRSLERLAYILEELRDGYAFLSKPADFNDPYDSALSISWDHALKQAIEQIGPEYGIDPKSMEPLFEEDQKEIVRAGFESLIAGSLSVFYGPGAFPDPFGFFREKLGASCFATNPNSVLMWSHYANQHKGICLEFSGTNILSSAILLELPAPGAIHRQFIGRVSPLPAVKD